MKKVWIGLFVLSIMNVCFAQKNKELNAPVLPFHKDTKLVTYQNVVNEKGSPQELYDRAMIWVKKHYKNTSEVIKKSDRDTGEIEMRSSVRIFSTLKDETLHLKNLVYYKFKIECRQDRYRYTITEFEEAGTDPIPIELWFDKSRPRWEPAEYKYLEQVNEQVSKIIESLQEGMLPVVEKSDDW